MRSGVTAIFADGDARRRAIFLIGADGIHSTVRQILLPEATPRYAGYVAWRGILEEGDLPPEIHDAVFDHFTFGLPEGELIIALPMPGARCRRAAGRTPLSLGVVSPGRLRSESLPICAPTPPANATERRDSAAADPAGLVAEVKAHAERRAGAAARFRRGADTEG